MGKLKNACIWCEGCGEVVGLPPQIPLCNNCIEVKENRELIRKGFPEEVKAWEAWYFNQKGEREFFREFGFKV